MTVLRTPFLRRLVAGLALAGLVVPLVPTAEAQTTAADRLVEVLGQSEAVQQALDAARHSADPLGAFVQAYALATGLDADDVRSKLGGDALWLTTEIPAPQAVLAASTPTGTTASAPLAAALAGPRPLLVAPRASEPLAPATPDLARGDRPSAHGARGP